VLSEDQIEEFRTVGGVRLDGLLDERWIGSLRAIAQQLTEQGYDPVARMTSKAPASRQQTLQTDGMWRDDNTFKAFLFDSPLAEASAQVCESSQVRLYEDLFQFRAPEISGEAGWHRDSIYWPISGHQLVNAWFPLEDVTADTGAIRFVAGSHLDEDAIAKAPLDPDDPTGGRRVQIVEANAGDVVLFHPRALHTGQGTNPDRPRRTFTIRFLGDDVRWQVKKAYYHSWMAEAGLQTGDVIDHPGFPICWAAGVPV
jgi:ectoine hydroxylase-related dioxygenase (phytanoyl-CoA dioxygenase family)